MKILLFYMMAIMAISWSGTTTMCAQSAGEPAVNPFPVSEKKKTALIKQFKKEADAYLEKYTDHQLSNWPENDRNNYLKAKALKVILMFATDYYRDNYANVEITKKETNKWIPSRPQGAFYEVRFFYDPQKEDLGCKDHAMIKVDVWEEDAQAKGFIIISINWGDFFQPPTWEDGLMEKWNQQGRKPYTYQKVGKMD